MAREDRVMPREAVNISGKTNYKKRPWEEDFPLREL